MTGTILVIADEEAGEMRHGAATQIASSRAGICTQNLRDSRALSLQVRRSPPHPCRTGKCSFCLGACGGSGEVGSAQILAKGHRV